MDIENYEAKISTKFVLRVAIDVKGNAQFLFLRNHQKLLVSALLHKNIKNHFHKKSNCVFL